MTPILGSTLQYSGLRIWFVGDSFVLFGSISSYCLFSHLAAYRLGRRLVKRKSEAIILNDTSFSILSIFQYQN